MISGTITDASSGRTLTGQTAEAFWNSVRHGDLLSIGFNCALVQMPCVHTLKPLLMLRILLFLRIQMQVYQMRFGEYDETPEQTAAFQKNLLKVVSSILQVVAVVPRQIISVPFTMRLKTSTTSNS